MIWLRAINEAIDWMALQLALTAIAMVAAEVFFWMRKEKQKKGRIK